MKWVSFKGRVSWFGACQSFDVKTKLRFRFLTGLRVDTVSVGSLSPPQTVSNVFKSFCRIFNSKCHHFLMRPVPRPSVRRRTLICFVLCRHRMVQYAQICFSALSMAEVNLSSRENNTATNCSTWVRSSSAGKCESSQKCSRSCKLLWFSIKSAYLKTQRYTYGFYIKATGRDFFPQILMLKVCKLEKFSAWNIL